MFQLVSNAYIKLYHQCSFNLQTTNCTLPSNSIMATFTDCWSNEALVGQNHKRPNDKIFSDKNNCWIWVWNQFLRRAEPSEQSRDRRRGMWCHRSISKSDDEHWGVFFFSQCLLSIIKPVHLVFLDTGSIRNQPVGFAVTTVSFQSLRLMRSLSFISALAPWQPTASRELHGHIVKLFFFSFNVTFPIWISDASLCGSTHNDLCFSSALLFEHKKPGGKSQREAKRAKSIIYSI